METFTKARQGMESLGASIFIRGVPQASGQHQEKKRTHQGLKVLAVTTSIGRGKGPQHGVTLVALQGRSKEAAPEVGSQLVAGHSLPESRPSCELHPGSRCVAGGDAPVQGLGPSLRSA